jgi:DNA-directed RNA polymerase specialized sigma24 family protein
MAVISPKERVLALLRRPEGVSIAEIAKATGWKRNTVRGFFSTVVRGELRLSLASHETDGVRIYRLVDTQR